MSSIRPDIATGLELEIIATVVLGGVSILGSSGNMIGVALAIFLVGLATYSMNLINIPSQVITIIMGLLLIVTVSLPQIFQYRAKRTT